MHQVQAVWQSSRTAGSYSGPVQESTQHDHVLTETALLIRCVWLLTKIWRHIHHTLRTFILSVR
jgi:hypothetical protein